MDHTTNMKNTTVYCEPETSLNQIGIFHKNDPFKHPHSLLILQIALYSIFKIIFEYLLLPLGENHFVPEILGGIAFGPSFLGQSKRFNEKMFSPKGTIVLKVFDSVGFLLLALILSVKMDVSIIKKSGKLPVVIGISAFVFPVAITTSMAFFIRAKVKLKDDVYQNLPIVAACQSTTSFHVILGLLSDFKLLNSELGRVAVGSSLISGLLSWFGAYAIYVARIQRISGMKHGKLPMYVSQLFLFVFIYVALRRVILWMMKQTPEGKPLKQGFICGIILMALGCGFFGEVTGQGFIIGPVFLGMVSPDRPLMGESILNRIRPFVFTAILPCCLIDIGRQFDVFAVGLRTFLVVELLLTAATLVKLVVIVSLSLYYKMPFLDAMALGFLLNCQGHFDILLFNRVRLKELITMECFSVMIITALVHSAIFFPLVKRLYDPSKKYVAYRRRTIQHANRHAELRVLACVHQQDNVPSIINILEASNPTRENPMGVYILNLEEVIGCSLPEIIYHKFEKFPSVRLTKADRMMNAFQQYEIHNEGFVTLQCFTAISPRVTMHEDVCSMALEMNTFLVIIPFQKSDRPFIKALNKKVIEKSPCSVGILYNRGVPMDCRSIFSGGLTFKACVIFIGGPDDREALAYATRMTTHPNITLTMLRLIAYDQCSDMMERRHDLFAISDFRLSTIDNRHVKFKEVRVTKVADTTQVLRSMDKDSYDLIVVGRRHDHNSLLFEGLSEWSEFEELGLVGDLLATSDFNSNASVFVLQQQASFVEKMVESPEYISQQLQ